MKTSQIKRIIEGVLLALAQPVTVDKILQVFAEEDKVTKADLQMAITALQQDYQQQNTPYKIKEVASGYRLQIKQDLAPWIARLWEEKPVKYSRAFLETLVLIAYRQPITRAEIEDIRGVAVSSHIVRTLMEREWVRVVGHRDVPGKPALLATTKKFLDYFNLKNLEELPTLDEVQDLQQVSETLTEQLELSVEAGVSTETTDPQLEPITGYDQLTCDDEPQHQANQQVAEIEEGSV